MVSQSFPVQRGKVGLGVGVFETLKVDLTVVLGRARMPLHMLLRMGRGAVIALDATDSDMVEILARTCFLQSFRIVAMAAPATVPTRTQALGGRLI